MTTVGLPSGNISLTTGDGGTGSFWDSFSNILNSAGSTFANIWGAVNQPTQTILPGGGVLQNGQIYYPQGTIGGMNSGSLILLLGVGLLVFVVLKK